MNKLDKLFKEKLEDHSLQASAQAWEKVESRLSKKNKMTVWLRAAAAVALLGLVTIAALNWSRSEEAQQKFVVDEKKSIEPKQPAPAEQRQEIAKAPEKKKTIRKPTQIEQQKAETVVEEVMTEQQPIASIEVEPAPLPLVEKKEKNIVLTYSLPTIKKPEPAETLIAEEAKKKGLERVLQIAKEVKNSDNPMGELREAKNDILAFEFKKDKDKKNH